MKIEKGDIFLSHDKKWYKVINVIGTTVYWRELFDGDGVYFGDDPDIQTLYKKQ